MKKIRRIRTKIELHPMIAFLVLTGFVIILSGILSLFNASVNYNIVNSRTGGYETTLITIQNLFSLRGLKYIFTTTVSNFVAFRPLSSLLIMSLGLGIMEKTGFLDSFFFAVTKRMPKYLVTFIITLISIICTITGDLSFVVLIPLTALLFKYGKRNPLAGIINAFAGLSLGYGINLTVSSIDSELISMTEIASRIISKEYTIANEPFFIIMIFATIIGAIIITTITERWLVGTLGKYEDEEEIIEDKTKLTRREIRGLLFALIGCTIYLIIFIYNIIPYAPHGGNFITYSSELRYIDSLFAPDSFFSNGFVFIITFFFFLAGLLYGLGAKTIKNHRELCDSLSYALNGIGKVIVLIFFASLFISLLKYTNIGYMFTAILSNLMANVNFGGIPFILLLLIVSIVSTFLLPSMTARWEILSGTVVPLSMTAGLTPEFAQLIFTAGSSVAYGLTPVMAYFVIYVAFMEKYDQDGKNGLTKCLRYIIPYSVFMLIMWIVLILLWYLVGIPIGIETSAIL